MRSLRVLLPCLAVSLISVALAADQPTQTPTPEDRKKLEDQIVTTVKSTDASKADLAAKRKLNDLKAELMRLIAEGVKKMTNEAGNASTSSWSQAAIKKEISDLQAERDSLNDSLGSWSTGLPSTTAQSAQPEKAVTTNGDTTDQTGNTPWTRAVVGFDIDASSARNPQSKVLAEFFVSAPIGGRNKLCPTDQQIAKVTSEATPPDQIQPIFSTLQITFSEASLKDVKQRTNDIKQRKKDCNNDPLNNRYWIWFNPRVSSLPQQKTFAFGSIGNPVSLLGLSTGDVNSVAQTLEFLGGLDIGLGHQGKTFLGDSQAPPRVGTYLTFGAGMTTPLVHDTSTPIVYPLNDTIRAAYGITDTSKSFVAFLPQDRSRFYLQYYAGLRFKTYYAVRNKDGSEQLDKAFPGQFDVTMGQNEAITGAGLNGAVVRLEGFYPLPFPSLKSVSVFGTILMRITGRPNQPTVILGAPQQADLFAANVARVNVAPAPNRDYFRIGLGFDLLSLIKKAQQPTAGQDQVQPKSNSGTTGNAGKPPAKP